ncbi:MAG: ATP-binding protein [Synergistaceae bacterium]|nr:ATP-binding protein [Synergistaceae bacterium]
MFHARTIDKVIARAGESFKVVMLVGMRQVGKTTLLKSMDERTCLTMDDPRTLAAAKSDPYLLFETNKPPLLIDEVQYAPELFPHVKMLVDGSDETGLIWMTGSQQFLLMKGVSETLAGRMAIIDLLGFSLHERQGKAHLHRPFLPSPQPAGVLTRQSAEDTYKIIWQGSFPGLITKPNADWSLFYSSYIKTYIERDIRQLANIGNELAFYNFLKAMAARTGQELNMSSVASDVGVTVPTVKAWLSVLRASGVIYLLQPYHQNVTKRIVKRPKMYFLDTGLAAYLTDWNTPAQLMAGAMSGPIFETFVVGEILKSYLHNGRQPSLYYYRDTNKVEIDLIIAEAGRLYPVEIKKTATPDNRMIGSFAMLEKLGMAVGHGALICLTNRPFPLTRAAAAISVWDM